jgi:hypothetical protein
LLPCSSDSHSPKRSKLTGIENRSTDLNADIQARSDCVDYYGDAKWFAGHRNGATGLENPNTEDINSE